MKSVISADSRHHNRFRRYALRSVPPPVRRVWDLDKIGVGIARTRAMLADPIDDAPSVIPQGRRPRDRPQTATEKHGQHRPVPEPLLGHAVRRVGNRLPERQPVLEANAPRLFRASRDLCEPPGFRCQQPDVSRLDRHLAHRRDPRYGHGAEPTGLQSAQPCVAVALVKPDSGSSPNHSMEFAERQVVHPAGIRGRSAVQH